MHNNHDFLMGMAASRNTGPVILFALMFVGIFALYVANKPVDEAEGVKASQSDQSPAWINERRSKSSQPTVTSWHSRRGG